MGVIRRRCGTLVVLGALLLTACGDQVDEDREADRAAAQREADCDSTVQALLATAQRYLDSIESTAAAAADTAAEGRAAPQQPADPAQAEEQFTRALADIPAYAGQIGCDGRQFRSSLSAGLQQMEAGGPVARAVLLQLRADSGDRPQPGPVPAGGDVAAAVAAAAPAAVVQLEAGAYDLAETLVLLRGVTLRGAGPDATVLRSGAAGGVVLVLTGEPVALEQLSLARDGDAAGSVVSAAPAATLAVTGARVEGARADAEGGGGIGVLMAAGAGGQAGLNRRVSLTFTDSQAVDNAVAGIVVSGEHRAEVVRAVVDRNGQCGICFLGTTDGAVRDSTFAGNAAGVVAAGDARPLVVGVTIRGGEIGVQVLDRASPQVEQTTVSGSARAAFLFADTATGGVRGSTCQGVPFGLVVGPTAAPEVDGNDCELARGQ